MKETMWIKMLLMDFRYMKIGYEKNDEVEENDDETIAT